MTRVFWDTNLFVYLFEGGESAARVRQGILDARAELLATESWIEQRDALLQLDAAALIADIALQRALGGGYESPQKFANSHSNAATTTP